MKELNLVKQDLKEDSIDIGIQNLALDPNSRKWRKDSKTSSKKEHEKWLNEVLDKRWEWNWLTKRLANSTTGFWDRDINYDMHTGQGMWG